MFTTTGICFVWDKIGWDWHTHGNPKAARIGKNFSLKKVLKKGYVS